MNSIILTREKKEGLHLVLKILKKTMIEIENYENKEPRRGATIHKNVIVGTYEVLCISIRIL